MKLKTIGILGGVVILLGLAAFGTVSVTGIWPGYSEGQRTGKLNQFSEKGFMNVGKGELIVNQFGISGGNAGTTTEGNVWAFNVKDDELKTLFEQYLGQDIVVEYRQWWRSPAWMTTSYQATSVRLVDPSN